MGADITSMMSAKGHVADPISCTQHGCLLTGLNCVANKIYIKDTKNIKYELWKFKKTKKFEMLKCFVFFFRKCGSSEMYFDIVGVFCMMNHYFEYRIRILCI